MAARTAPLSRSRLRWIAALTVMAMAAVGCVPSPAAPSGSVVAESTAVTTPEPTPAGPTPVPTFIRPTPTPLPTFLVYVVQAGDSLEGIGDRFGTSGRSIAQWNRFRYPSLDPLSDEYEPDRIVVGWTLGLIPDQEYDPEELPEPSA